MGDVVPFKRKRRWTRPEDYGHDPDPPEKGGGGKRDKSPRRSNAGWRAYAPLAFWIVVLGALSLWVVSDPALVDPPGFLAGEPERVSGTFTECGKAGSANCVIDGDTLRIGKRSIRVIGIDAPETRRARCPAEAEAGARATAELLRLVNAGPFTMTGRLDGPTDKYGRELRALSRTDADGTARSLAEAMIASGTVRRYTGGARADWCPQAEP